MGRPKALLPFDGEPLIVHIVCTLGQRFADIVVVAAPEQELPALPVTLIRDEVAYQGPVGGIYYGLRGTQREVCFVTSCDAPFLDLSFISYLIEQITDFDVVVPHWQDRLQPLHAVYRRSVAPLLQEQLQRGELRPVFLYKKVRTREVSAEEIRRFDPEGLSFRNMNSPEDYQAALVLWQENRQRQRERQRNQTATTKGDREIRQRQRKQTGTETETAPPFSSSVSVSSSVSASSSISSLCLTCTVELFGVARLKAKTDRVSLVLPAGANLGDALAALARTIPELVGPVLTTDCRALTAGYACNLNGVEFTRDLYTPLRSGDSLLILSSDAGG
jgi:molybdopterin-guanine dinucleotide biosynthesis protein A/molybdopterin converting factor small subunit